MLIWFYIGVVHRTGYCTSTFHFLMEFSTVYKVLSPKLSEYQAVADYLQERPHPYLVTPEHYEDLGTFLQSIQYLKSPYPLSRLDKGLSQLCKRAASIGDETFVLLVAVNLKQEADQRLMLEHLMRVHQQHFRIAELIHEFVAANKDKIEDSRLVSLALYTIGAASEFCSFVPSTPKKQWTEHSWDVVRSVLVRTVESRQESDEAIVALLDDPNTDLVAFTGAALGMLARRGLGLYLTNSRVSPSVKFSEEEQESVSAQLSRWSERAAAILKSSHEEPLAIRILLTVVLTLLCKAQGTRTPSEILAIPGTAQLPCAFQLILGLETIADGITSKDSQEPLQQALRILSGEILQADGTSDAGPAAPLALWIDENDGLVDSGQTLAGCGYLLKCYRETGKNGYFCLRRLREVAGAYLGKQLKVEVGLPPLADACLCLFETLGAQ